MSQPWKVVIVGGGFRSSHQRPHAGKHDIGGQFLRQRLGHPEIDNLWRGVAVDLGDEDDRAGNKIVAKVHVLWGARGAIGPLWDVLATWRAKAASTVTGRSLDCGHFLQEERPEETLEELCSASSPQSKVRSNRGLAQSSLASLAR